MTKHFPFTIFHLLFHLSISKFSNQKIRWKVADDKSKIDRQGGQALIMLLFFIMIGITITTTAILIIAGNSLAATDVQQGEVARQMAETGAENALLQILRGNYANESIILPEGTIEVTITNGGNITIDSVGTAGNYVKKVRVTATKDGMMDVTSWKEIN
jgi:hypothetical protein